MAALVGRPLPTNFVVADALAPFAPPALGDKGLCKSKYMERAETDTELQNVKETSEWNSHKKDPIFASLSDDGRLVPLKEIDAIYRPHQIEQELADFDRIREPDHREDHREDHHARYDDHEDVMNSLENALGGREIKSPLNGDRGLRPRKRTHSQSRGDDLYRRESENLSSWRDTTGNSMRGKVPTRPYPPPTPQESYDENGHHLHSRSTSPRRYGLYVSPTDIDSAHPLIFL